MVNGGILLTDESTLKTALMSEVLPEHTCN